MTDTMQLTRPIPDEAMPVALEIRRMVKRPKTLPTSTQEQGLGLRWRDNGCRCPAGMLPYSKQKTPGTYRGFDWPDEQPPFTARNLYAFIDWWDVQDTALAAVNAVWPPDGTDTETRP